MVVLGARAEPDLWPKPKVAHCDAVGGTRRLSVGPSRTRNEDANVAAAISFAELAPGNHIHRTVTGTSSMNLVGHAFLGGTND